MSNIMGSRVSYSLTFVTILLIVTIVITIVSTIVIIPIFIITAAIVPASLFLPLVFNIAIISFFSAQVISSCLFLADCA